MEKRKLSNPQLNIYNTQKTFSGTSITNIGGSALVSGCDFDCELWAKALNMYFLNNESTRMRIAEDDYEPLQYFLEHQDITFDFFDLTSNTEEERQALYSKWMREQFSPDEHQIKFRILKLDKGQSGFFIVGNHAVCDAYSIGTMVEQINNSYINLLLDGDYVGEKKPSYVDFLDREEEYKNSEAYSKDQAFWHDMFTEMPSRTSISSKSNITNSVEADRYSFRISKELTQRINDFCSKNNVSAAVLFESIVFAYMNRITGENDIIMGSPLLNRTSRTERQMSGMFISTIPFKATINRDMPFSELFSTVSKTKKLLFKHQKYSFSDIQDDIRKQHGYTDRLFDVVVSYINAKTTEDDSNISVKTQWIPNGFSANELIINIDDLDNSNELNLNFDFQTAAFSRAEIENITGRLLKMVDQVIENADLKVEEVDILTERDKELYQSFNINELASTGKTIQEVFEEQVESNPDKIALIFENQTFTYRQLNAMANSLAHTIRKYNLSKDEIIPIVGVRDFNTIISMLAVAKAGHAYFVIDYNEYPDGRVDTLLSDFNPKVLIKNKSDYNYAGALEIDLAQNDSWSDDITNPVNINNTNDKLCLIHTSGSTGKPKTVIYSHDGAVNMGKNLSFVMEDSDYCISLITMSFDAFQLDTYLPLLNGKTLVLSSASELKSITGTEKLLSKYPNSFTITVPNRLEQYLSESQSDAWRNIHAMVLGGEVITPQLLSEIRSKMDVQLYNLYGPTETTVCNCGKKIVDGDTNVGKPLPGFNIVILDKNNIVLPIGAIGEIAVAGVGVAQGYLNRPELTDDRFIQLGEPYNMRVYKTGDYGCINENNELEFKGRRDEQVKCNGIRMELKEIESVMNTFPNIMKSAVIIKHHNGRDHLIAYYTAVQTIDEDSLLSFLEKQLPLYMVPQFFHQLDQMPSVTSGKVVKDLLPDLSYESILELTYEEPLTDMQKAICAIWMEVLDQEKVGISNTFSSLGGTSKDMIKMLLMLEKKMNIVIETKDIPKNPTIVMLEEIITGKRISSDIDENWDLTDIEINHTKNAKGAILLTGATGYLGNHFLQEILLNSTAEVYCLVRDQQKLAKTLAFYFGNDLVNLLSRIHVIVGDISEEKLGLSDAEYEELNQSISQVINCAGNVNHYGSIEEFAGVNVTGVWNILKLCASSGAKLHQLSTLSVSGHGLTRSDPTTTTFTEEYLYIGQKYKDNPYVWTKYLAEKMVRQYQEVGGDANIYRIGTLDKRSYDDKFQINQDDNGFQLIVESVRELGVIPRLLAAMPTYVIPVDKCAEIVMKLANGIPDNRTYHIYEPEPKNFKEYLASREIKYYETDLLQYMALIEKLIDGNSKYIILHQYLKNYMLTGKKLKVKNTKSLAAIESVGGYEGQSSRKSFLKALQRLLKA